MTIEKLKCKLQYLLPHHFLSRTLARLADCKIPAIKNRLIKIFIAAYNIDLTTAASARLEDYPSFNEFFTRKLNKAARPVAAAENALVSPADGTVSQHGKILDGQLLQAKGHNYQLSELLGSADTAAKFLHGDFITIYLAPSDYHRVHMPLDGILLKTIYVPGRLFSVNTGSVAAIPNIFCRNERLIALFDSAIGQFAMVMVGAMLVAGIKTVWGEKETPCQSTQIVTKDYQSQQIRLAKGAEMGHFQFGSTVILVCQAGKIALDALEPGCLVQMGSQIGIIEQG